MPSRPALRALTAAAAAAALLVPAAAAQAAKTPVSAGLPAAQAAQMPENAEGNAFYPRAITVKKGGKAAFKFRGFHNVVFPAKGDQPPPLVAPDPSSPVSGATDAAGAPFFFNGQPNILPVPESVAPLGNKKITGKKLNGSGIFMGQGAPPDYVVSFPKKGSYAYYCTIHPGMDGTVKVVGKRGKATSKRKAKRQAARQADKTVAKAEQLAAVVPSGNVVQAGSDAGEVANLAFFPAARTVTAGGSVDFRFSADSTEIHNVVFGPDDYVAALAEKFFGPTLDPQSVYPSDPPPLTHTPTSHGNGFLNTGILDADGATPFPASAAVTFSTPGSYKFICTVHPFMTGTITVQ